ncbi:MAG: hypothetical protein FWC00_05930 [Firmicutes bacterium]|nr:hypothetical protein [Bacillota bacterium]
MVKNNGRVVDFFAISDHAQAVKEFAEGSASLEALLTFCFQNGIVTNACCAGHGNHDKPTIVFKDTEKTRPYVLRAIDELLKSKYEIRFNSLPGDEHALWLFTDENVGDVKLTTEQAWDGLEGNKVFVETELFDDLLAVFKKGGIKNVSQTAVRAFLGVCDKIKKDGRGNQITTSFYWDTAFFYNINCTGPPPNDGLNREERGAEHEFYTATQSFSVSGKHEKQFVKMMERAFVALDIVY